MEFSIAERMFQQDRDSRTRRFTQRIAISEAAIPVSQRTSRGGFCGRQFVEAGPSKGHVAYRIRQLVQLTDCQIDAVIRAIYAIDRSARKAREPDLAQLIVQDASVRLGGLHQNSLEKTIVDNYVKKITDFETLICESTTNYWQACAAMCFAHGTTTGR